MPRLPQLVVPPPLLEQQVQVHQELEQALQEEQLEQVLLDRIHSPLWVAWAAWVVWAETPSPWAVWVAWAETRTLAWEAWEVCHQAEWEECHQAE